VTDYTTYSTETLVSLYSAYNQHDDFASYCEAQAIKQELNNRRQEI
jgi:hypothetical protein